MTRERYPKPKRTPDAAEKLLAALRLGATYELAAHYAGMSKDTFDRWRAEDASFAAQVKEAEGAAAVGWLTKIEAAASNGEWTAAAWKLERRYPHQYGRQAITQTNYHIDVTKLTDEQLDALIATQSPSRD